MKDAYACKIPKVSLIQHYTRQKSFALHQQRITKIDPLTIIRKNIPLRAPARQYLAAFPDIAERSADPVGAEFVRYLPVRAVRARVKIGAPKIQFPITDDIAIK